MAEAQRDRDRLVVLVSGTGTNLQALLDAQARPGFPAEVVAVGSDRSDAGGLIRAERAELPTFVVDPAEFGAGSGKVWDRAGWDRLLAARIAAHQPDWIVSAGFMRLLGSTVLSDFPNLVINTHPALLPAFPGAHAVHDALEYGVKVTGCTVHVIDAGVDTGPIIAQEAVTVAGDDTVESLHERIKQVERELLVAVVERLATSGLNLNGRKVD
ncbi:MAG: phosphoribosylglycinamide formyltransferase [Candidatus Nanopelagicales bacterium]|nr:phosphoribosylglycinamide formyltransferase [Candidatus Nanopelagicales bacterium]